MKMDKTILTFVNNRCISGFHYKNGSADEINFTAQVAKWASIDVVKRKIKLVDYTTNLEVRLAGDTVKELTKKERDDEHGSRKNAEKAGRQALLRADLTDLGVALP